MTALEFKAAVGREPEDDDLERCNCPKEGQTGHRCCGVCRHGLPRFICSECVAENFRQDGPNEY